VVFPRGGGGMLRQRLEFSLENEGSTEGHPSLA